MRTPGVTFRLCPPFLLLRGYPSGAKLVLGLLQESPPGGVAAGGGAQ